MLFTEKKIAVYPQTHPKHTNTLRDKMQRFWELRWAPKLLTSVT